MEVILNYIEIHADKTQPLSSAGQLSLKPKLSRLVERHFAEHIPGTSSKPNISRRCKLCYSSGIRRETRFWCLDCKFPLCVPKCFKEYHTKE